MLTDTQRADTRSRIQAASAAGQASVMLDGMRRLLRESPKQASDAMFCASILSKTQEALESQANARRLKTFIVRSVTLEPALPFLSVEAALLGFALEIEIGGYGSYVDDMLSQQGALALFNPELVVVVLDLEDIAGKLPDMCASGRAAAVQEEIEAAVERLRQMLQGLRARSSARLVIQGFVVPNLSALGDVGDANVSGSLPRAVSQLNDRLAALCNSLADCAFFDVDRIASRHGRERWRDARLFLSSRLPLTAGAFSVYAQGLARSIAALFCAPRKVLCTDLDNTLWGGILGEDGAEGIATGSAFPGNCYLEYQRYLRQLAARGILLAIVSKNNEPDVLEAFQTRAADLALTLNDFVVRRINWNDKAVSIREIAAELSLGLDAFVFVDDNPVECEAIRRELPEVAIVAAPVEEPWRLVEKLCEQSFFDTRVITDDDVARVQEYRAQTQRAELAGSMANREEFLASLNIVCTFLPVAEAPLARAVQLLAKTNQFNLTTRRHGAAEVEQFASDERKLAVAVRVRDRFGDAGVVGLALAGMRNDTAYIDSFLLSCRVIGRGIESALLARIGAWAKQRGATRLIGEYIPTRKNGLCADFYSDHGFTGTSCAETGGGLVCYEFQIHAGVLESPAWLTLEGKEDYEFAADTGVAS